MKTEKDEIVCWYTKHSQRNIIVHPRPYFIVPFLNHIVLDQRAATYHHGYGCVQLTLSQLTTRPPLK
jgi:hypothetical protein